MCVTVSGAGGSNVFAPRNAEKYNANLLVNDIDGKQWAIPTKVFWYTMADMFIDNTQFVTIVFLRT